MLVVCLTWSACGYNLIRVVGHEGKVICKQHVGDQTIWNTTERAFQPGCNAIDVVQVDGRGERGYPCST